MEGSNERKRPLQNSKPKIQEKRGRLEDTLEKFDRCKTDVVKKCERSGRDEQEKSGERCTGNQENCDKDGDIGEQSEIPVRKHNTQSKKNIGARRQSVAEKLSTRARDEKSGMEKYGRNDHHLEMEDISSSDPWSDSDEALSDTGIVDAIQEVGEDFDEGGELFMSDDEFVVMDEVYSDEFEELSDNSDLDLELIGVTRVDKSASEKHNERDNSKKTADRNGSKIRSDRDDSKKTVDRNSSKIRSDGDDSKKTVDRNSSKIQSDRDDPKKTVDRNSSKSQSDEDNSRNSVDQKSLKIQSDRDNSRKTLDMKSSKIQSDRDNSKKSVDQNMDNSKKYGDQNRDNSKKSVDQKSLKIQEERSISKIDSERDNSSNNLKKSVDQKSSKIPEERITSNIHHERDNSSKAGNQSTSEIHATQNRSEIQEDSASSKVLVDQNSSKIQGDPNNSTSPVDQNSEKNNSVDPNKSKSVLIPNISKNPVDQNTSTIQSEGDPSKNELDLYKIKFLGARKKAKKRKRKGRHRTSSDSEFTESDDTESDDSDTPRDVLNEIGDDMSLDELPTSIDRMIGRNIPVPKYIHPSKIPKPSEITRRSDIIHLQKTDYSLNGVRASLKNHDRVVSSKYGNGYRFVIKKKGMYRETFHELNTNYQFVLPRQCRFDAILWGHYYLDEHLDRKATMQRLRQVFYWPGMNLDVAEYSRSCQVCKLAKIEKKAEKKINPTQPQVQPNIPQEEDLKLESFVVLGNGLVSSFKKQLDKNAHKKDLSPEEVPRELGISRFVKKIYLLGENSHTIEELLSFDLKSYKPAGIIMDCGAQEVLSGVNPVNVAKTLVTVAKKLADDHNCHIGVQSLIRRESRPQWDNAVIIFNKTLTVLCGKDQKKIFLYDFQYRGFRLIRETSDWIWSTTDGYSNNKSGFNAYSKHITSTIRFTYKNLKKQVKNK